MNNDMHTRTLKCVRWHIPNTNSHLFHILRLLGFPSFFAKQNEAKCKVAWGTRHGHFSICTEPASKSNRILHDYCIRGNNQKWQSLPLQSILSLFGHFNQQSGTYYTYTTRRESRQNICGECSATTSTKTAFFFCDNENPFQNIFGSTKNFDWSLVLLSHFTWDNDCNWVLPSV